MHFKPVRENKSSVSLQFVLSLLLLWVAGRMAWAGEGPKEAGTITGQKVRFVVFGDPHIPSVYFQRMIPEINKEAVDMVFAVGDLINGKFEDPAVLAKNWDESVRVISEIRHPLFPPPDPIPEIKIPIS